ncbi:MAG TPA: hypothetical protein VLZ56_04100, partial [Mycoplana sp.]|nr:hypothetical protein [Mycoplana sp.]
MTRKDPLDQQSTGLLKADIEAIVEGRHADPFSVLGVQQFGDTFIARCFIPHAETVTAETIAGKVIGALDCLD